MWQLDLLTTSTQTVKMKVKDEEAIISAMQQISDRLPDFKIYRRIYPDPSLESMLADAYRDIILLAREATSYFEVSTFRKSICEIPLLLIHGTALLTRARTPHTKHG